MYFKSLFLRQKIIFPLALLYPTVNLYPVTDIGSRFIRFLFCHRTWQGNNRAFTVCRVICVDDSGDSERKINGKWESIVKYWNGRRVLLFLLFFFFPPFSLLFFREYSVRGVNRGAKIKIKGKNIGLKIFFGGGKMDLNINWIRVYRIGYGFQYRFNWYRAYAIQQYLSSYVFIHS